MTKLFAFFDSVPPPLALIAAILSIQIGSALATFLFPTLGIQGTAAARIVLSALVLLVLVPGTMRSFWQHFLNNRLLLFAYGFCICVMNFSFYLAISKIPLGATVAIEFLGPLGVSLLASRKLLHFVCVGFAALGVLLLSPIANSQMNLAGTLFALAAGLGWACFILLTGRISKRIEGHAGLAIGMTIAAVLVSPFFFAIVDELYYAPKLLLGVSAVAILATALPFALEFSALKRMSTRAYGILISLEPAAAVVIGMAVLGERLGWLSLVAVAMIVAAAIAITFLEKSDP